jgi:riboflavin-specific deaminase-like protein
VRRLLPDQGETDVAEQYSGLGLVERAHEDRPYLVTNFALTIDGRATIDGRSGPIGSRTDMQVLHRLRGEVDAVMIGGGTMRVERYGRIVPDPADRGRRERANGLAPDPLAVIVTDNLDLPWDAGLFTVGYGRVQIITSSEDPVPETATSMRVDRHQGAVDLRLAMTRLRQERGVRALLCEGGPHLHGQLLAAGLVDELFVTRAPKLAVDPAPSLVEGVAGGPIDLDLVWLLEEDGELYGRYAVR